MKDNGKLISLFLIVILGVYAGVLRQNNIMLMEELSTTKAKASAEVKEANDKILEGTCLEKLPEYEDMV
jgi:hypothetical protein